MTEPSIEQRQPGEDAKSLSSVALDAAEIFPGVPLTREVAEFGTLLAIDQARAVLGYQPRHSWRDDLTVS